MRLTPARLGERESGEVLVSFTGTSNTSHTVAFGEPFAAPPRVWVEITSNLGTTAQFEARPINITATGFTLWVNVTDLARTAQTFTNVPVHWKAEL
jgi:hypothetical protein